MNIGRLVVPNVFISLELIKALTDRYDPKTKTIYDKENKPLVTIRKDFIETVFNLDFGNEARIDNTQVCCPRKYIQKLEVALSQKEGSRGKTSSIWK